MKDLRDYQVAFVGLKLGIHHFNFGLNDNFFAQFEESLLKKGNVFVDITFDKKDRLFVLNFDISGSVEVECDRCAEAFNLPIHGNYTLYVKTGAAEDEDMDNEEVIWITEGESILDLGPIIYEFIHLSIPIQKLHPASNDGKTACNPEVIAQLILHEEKNKQDPRWDILNNLNQN